MELGQGSLGGKGEVTMGEMLSVLRSSKASEVAGVLGKVVGTGLFAALVYSYCNVLLDACVRGVQ